MVFLDVVKYGRNVSGQKVKDQRKLIRAASEG